MADEKLSMEYGSFRSAGHRLQYIGESLASAYGTFLGETERQGSPWGADVYGSAFAAGDGKYLSAMRHARQAAEGDDGYLAFLRRLGEDAVASADRLEAEDETQAAGLRAERPGQV